VCFEKPVVFCVGSVHPLVACIEISISTTWVFVYRNYRRLDAGQTAWRSFPKFRGFSSTLAPYRAPVVKDLRLKSFFSCQRCLDPHPLTSRGRYQEHLLQCSSLVLCLRLLEFLVAMGDTRTSCHCLRLNIIPLLSELTLSHCLLALWLPVAMA
jgi:hypothetical protein